MEQIYVNNRKQRRMIMQVPSDTEPTQAGALLSGTIEMFKRLGDTFM
jgi:hypothetical protein